MTIEDETPSEKKPKMDDVEEEGCSVDDEPEDVENQQLDNMNSHDLEMKTGTNDLLRQQYDSIVLNLKKVAYEEAENDKKGL